MNLDEAVIRLAAGILAGNEECHAGSAIREAVKAIENNIGLIIESENNIKKKYS